MGIALLTSDICALSFAAVHRTSSRRGPQLHIHLPVPLYTRSTHTVFVPPGNLSLADTPRSANGDDCNQFTPRSYLLSERLCHHPSVHLRAGGLFFSQGRHAISYILATHPTTSHTFARTSAQPRMKNPGALL